MIDEQNAIKAATHRLIKSAGGVLAAEAVTGYSKASLSNAQSLSHDCTLPIGHVVALEQFVGSPIVTREMARMQGFEVTAGREQHPTTDNLDTLCLRITRELGEAIAAVEGKDRFSSMGAFHAAEKEVADLYYAAVRLMEEVRRHDPRKNSPLRVVREAAE